MNNRIWFKPWRWIYAPVSAAGWLAVVLTLLFCANTFLAIDRHSHSVSDTRESENPRGCRSLIF